MRFLALLLIAAGAAPCARAVELRLRFSAIERMLAEQMFTEEGRRYVGSKRTKCNFAYLQKPRISGEGGRVRISALFTGRTSLDVFGRCVGLGDEFDLIITARPQYKGDAIRFADVKVQGAKKNTFYTRRVCSAMAASLERDFQYPLASEARRILEDSSGSPQYRRGVKNFSVQRVDVTSEEIVLDLNFALTIQ